MNNIFRVPVDNQHFKDTIETGKPVQKVLQFLTGEQRVLSQRIAKSGVVHYWGSMPGEANKRHFAKLRAGDELLCYRSGQYIALAKIAFTTINRNLAQYSWGQTELGTTWELIYFFEDVKLFQIPSSLINVEFGFKDGPVMGFSSISKERLNLFTNKHGSVEKFIKKLDYDRNLEIKISKDISRLKIQSRFEAQFYLVDLGNQLKFDTYIPPSDAGHQAFGKKLGELITVRKEELSNYVAPAIFDPLSNIDVIWFKGNYIPKYFYEVIHRTGWSEAFLRLDLVSNHYDSSLSRIVGPDESRREFAEVQRRWSGPKNNLSFKDYSQLINVHSESLLFQKLVNNFLD